ncbi:MAG TPA: 16S rRNA (cytosine(967)-C(5))-methyltransferase RsmB [Candidatus Eisenbacteria bacterium]
MRADRRRLRRRAAPDAREIALQVLAATESRSAYSDRLLQSRLRDASLAPEEARLVTALVMGVLRRRATLDHHLAALAGGNWGRLPLWIRTALRIGAYQLLFLDRIPAPAAVGESVSIAKRYGHPGTAGLVNAVLRKLASGERAALPDAEADPVSHLAVKHSHPAWIVRRWLLRYGREAAERWLEADNEEPSVSVRPSIGRITMEDLARRLSLAGHAPVPGPNGGPVLVLPGGFVAGSSSLFREGLLSLQDEAESVVAALLGASPGERVLDLCAAPGGKASQIAEQVAPDGRVAAVERHPSRAAALRANLLERLHLAGVDVICADGLKPPFAAPFDRVLLDAPCSGLGVLRRRADARWRKAESVVAALASMQRPLLEGAAALTRPGGVLVYSVCSLEPEETDQVVSSFLAAHPEWTQEDARPYLPPAFRGDGPALRATPARHGTDGVFAARFLRT